MIGVLRSWLTLRQDTSEYTTIRSGRLKTLGANPGWRSHSPGTDRTRLHATTEHPLGSSKDGTTSRDLRVNKPLRMCRDWPAKTGQSNSNERVHRAALHLVLEAAKALARRSSRVARANAAGLPLKLAHGCRRAKAGEPNLRQLEPDRAVRTANRRHSRSRLSPSSSSRFSCSPAAARPAIGADFIDGGVAARQPRNPSISGSQTSDDEERRFASAGRRRPTTTSWKSYGVSSTIRPADAEGCASACRWYGQYRHPCVDAGYRSTSPTGKHSRREP